MGRVVDDDVADGDVLRAAVVLEEHDVAALEGGLHRAAGGQRRGGDLRMTTTGAVVKKMTDRAFQIMTAVATRRPNWRAFLTVWG